MWELKIINPKVEVLKHKNYQSKVELQERINNREREQSLFLGESVRKIENLYKRR